MKQKTIAISKNFKGISLHYGTDVSIEFHPADPNKGVLFLHNGKRISATIENVLSTDRGTNVGGIGTVEHVLSAINGLGIDNVEIVVNGDEMPAGDGSSKLFFDLLNSAGFVEQKEPKRMIFLKEEILIESNGARISAFPQDHLSIEAAIDYPHAIVGKQTAEFDENINSFGEHIAPARTFGLLSEVEELKKRGLAKGASFENAVAILDSGYSSPLRFPNELARHKILDIMGDIVLAGKKINARIVSEKAGHKLNIELVRRIINAS